MRFLPAAFLLASTSCLFSCGLGRQDTRVGAIDATFSLDTAQVPADNVAAAHVTVQLTLPQPRADVRIAGRRVTLRSDESCARIGQPGLTDAAGYSQATVASQCVGAVTLTGWLDEGDAQVGLGPVGTVTFTAVVPGPPADSVASFVATHGVAAADSSAPIPVTFTLTDATGLPLSGHTVTFSVMRPGDRVMPAQAVTDPHGRVTVSLSATTLGASTVAATAGAIVARASITFVSGPPDLGTSSLVVNAGPGVIDPQQPILARLVVADAQGRPVPFVPVAYASNVAADMLTTAATETDAQGMSTLSVSTARAGTHTLTANFAGRTLRAAFTRVAGAIDANHTTLTATPQTLPADGRTPARVTLSITDTYGNPIGGQSVALSRIGNAGPLSQPLGMTDALGMHEATLTSAQVGTTNVLASLGAQRLVTPLTFTAVVPVSGCNVALPAPPRKLLLQIPTSTLAADIDGDGADEIVTTGLFDGALTVYKKSGLDDWNAVISTPIVKNTQLIAALHMNADNFADLLSYHTVTQTLTLWLGSGDGRFVAGSTFSLPPSRYSAAIGNIYGNGNHDLVLVESSNPTLRIFAGTQDGALAAPETSTLPGSSQGLIIEDFDGDGFDDIALIDRTNSNLALYLNAQGTGFASPATYPLDDQPTGIVAADFFQTGHADLGISVDSGNITIYRNDGSGQLQRGDDVSGSPHNNRLLVLQRSSQSSPSLVASSVSSDSIYIYDGQPDGTFNEHQRLKRQNFSGNPYFVANLGPAWGPSLVSMNGAPSFDTVTLSHDLFVPIDAYPKTFELDGYSFGAVLEDLDADGKLDFVYSAFPAQINIMRGAGDGSFLPQEQMPAGASPYAICLGDINGDGRKDIAVAFADEPGVGIYLGQGNASFAPYQTYPAGNFPFQVVASDLNNDGLDDVVVTNPGDQMLSILFAQADGTLLPAITAGTGPSSASVLTGDFNEDGRLDILVGDSSFQFGILLNSGDGNFSPMLSFGSTPQNSSVSIGDFNGDGHLDVACSGGITPLFFQFYLGDGAGNFVISQTVSMPLYQAPNVFSGYANNPITQAVVDINGDGVLDLISGSLMANTFVLLGQGDGTFGPIQTYLGGMPQIVLTGDLNRDGRPDILTLGSSDVAFAQNGGCSP